MLETPQNIQKKPGRIVRLFCCLIAAAAISAPKEATAQAAAVESLGAQRCSALIEAQQSNQTLYAAFAVWIGGYLTAANAYEPDTFDLTPWQPVELAAAQIAKACAQQETATVANAVASYVNYLKAGRLTEPGELTQVRGENTGVFIYKSVLDDVRRRLTDRGAVITGPEGQFNQGFGQALLAFQRQNNLSPTGLPDTQTLIQLFR